MTSQEQKTWDTLRNLTIDDSNSSFKFSDRLAKENGWSKQFALNTIEEYKKFVFLAKHAGHPVTPSLEVDEAWHLHMIYTKSYWGDMCKEIDFQLHHGPTKGGHSENVKFTNWYEKTKESYFKYFGVPDELYWPKSEARFAPNNIVKVNKNTHFVFKKPSFKRQMAANISILPASILLLLTKMDWIWIILGIVVVWLIIAYIVKIIKRNNRGGGGSSSSCSSSYSSGCGGLGWIIFACGGSSGCGSSSSSHGCGSSGCSSSSSGCSSGGSSCGSSCGGGCGS